MNRRTCLRRLATGAAVGVAAPYVPLAQLLVAPPARRWTCVVHVGPSMVTRLDVLYGFATLRPDLACRVEG
jgi:hypothetical protein